eukprot:jgi/Ulvmu1/6754/UM030_0089.1
MLQPLKLPPVRNNPSFLFNGSKFSPDGPRESCNTTQLATVPSSYSPPDALSRVEHLCGCSIASLLRVDGDSNQANDVLLHNSQLRVALTELLGVHHQCAGQGAAMKRIVQQMLRELTSLRQQNATRDLLNRARTDPLDPAAETAALKEAWARMNAYSQQAAASQLAVDEARLESKRLKTQLDACSQAHALEQKTLNSELKQLQERCAMLEMRTSDLSDRAVTAERELLFAREQLSARTTQADNSQAELHEQIEDLKQASAAVAEQAAASQQALIASEQRCCDLQADLRGITNKLDDALTKMEWYEQRLSSMTAPAPEASAGASPTLKTGRNDSHGEAQHTSPASSVDENRQLLKPLRTVPNGAHRRSSGQVPEEGLSEPHAAPFSPASMPLTLAGAQRSKAARPSSLRRHSAARSVSPDGPVVASFGRGPAMAGSGHEGTSAGPAPCAAGGEDCVSLDRPYIEVDATRSGPAGDSQPVSARQPFADVRNQTPRHPGRYAATESSPARQSAQVAVACGSDCGDASLDAWTRGASASSAEQLPQGTQGSGVVRQSMGMQAGEDVGAGAGDCGAQLQEGRDCGGADGAESQSVALWRSSEWRGCGGGRAGGGPGSDRGGGAGPGWPAGIRPDESARSSATGGAGAASEAAEELQQERMRNEALLFALQQAREGDAAAGAAAPRQAGGGGPIKLQPVQTSDVGCQMVFNHVFGLDAITQCNLGEEGLAAISDRGDSSAWIRRSGDGGLQRGAGASAEARRAVVHGQLFEQQLPRSLVFELPDDIDQLLEDEPEWETLVASLSGA